MAHALPSTPQSAPPNFYSQVGQMAAGQGGPQQGGSATQPAPAAAAATPPDADQQFLAATTKLMDVLNKMKAMKPRGQDISKYMDAMGQTCKQCIESVFGGSDQTQVAGSDQANASTNAPAAGGQAGTNAGAPAPTS
jgi:hypothetical protein